MSNPHFVERKACPVCGSSNIGQIYSCSYTEPPIRTTLEARYAGGGTADFSVVEGAEFVLVECRACSLVYQRDVPDAFLAEIVYERWNDPDRAWDHRARAALRAKGRYALEIMGVLDFIGADPQELRFLDYGMGWGLWVEMARAFGVDVYGLEPSAARMERASQQGINVVDDDEMRNLTFDFINTEQVFEHLADPCEVAVDLASLLRPGGILKISVPNAMRVKRLLKRGDWLARQSSRRSLNDVYPLMHLNAFNHDSLVTLGERAGLRPQRIPPRLRYRYMPTWERPSRILKRTVGAHYRDVRGQETVIWFRRPGERRERVSAKGKQHDRRRKATSAREA